MAPWISRVSNNLFVGASTVPGGLSRPPREVGGLVDPPKIYAGAPSAATGHRLDHPPHAVVRAQPVAGPQLVGAPPPRPDHVDRVLARGPDDPARHHQAQDRADPREH